VRPVTLSSLIEVGTFPSSNALEPSHLTDLTHSLLHAMSLSSALNSLIREPFLFTSFYSLYISCLSIYTSLANMYRKNRAPAAQENDIESPIRCLEGLRRRVGELEERRKEVG
jgi:hypothetical protein